MTSRDTAHNRIEVLHGVNLDTLGRRDPEQYGTFTLRELETKIGRWADELELRTTFFQTNHEGEFCEYLHRLPDLADAAIVNAGAWTHYSWAIRDAIEVAGVPFVEVHISDVSKREDWRKDSIFEGLALEKISGEGADGYRRALEAIKAELGA
jgi:3-dehydroquinate dehydratase-2